MQPVFNDFNSTHSSLKQLNKLTFLFNPIKSKERVNIDGPKLMVGFVLMPSINNNFISLGEGYIYWRLRNNYNKINN